MGEIGIPRREYLYELPFWELMLIHRGYLRRHRNMWSATRWQTYSLMKVSMADTTKIRTPRDLMVFPWEENEEEHEIIPDSEIERLREEMRRYNQEHQTDGAAQQ